MFDFLDFTKPDTWGWLFAAMWGFIRFALPKILKKLDINLIPPTKAEKEYKILEELYQITKSKLEQMEKRVQELEEKLALALGEKGTVQP